jgi:hypothetical protein
MPKSPRPCRTGRLRPRLRSAERASLTGGGSMVACAGSSGETGASSPAQVVAAEANWPAATPAFQRNGRFGGQVRRDRLRRTGGARAPGPAALKRHRRRAMCGPAPRAQHRGELDDTLARDAQGTPRECSSSTIGAPSTPALLLHRSSDGGADRAPAAAWSSYHAQLDA